MSRPLSAHSEIAMYFRRWSLPLTVALAAAVAPLGAQSLSNISYVNGVAIPGGAEDLAGSASSFNRLGFFSDLYYDRNSNEWWAVSDRGPGGGVISYDTRMQRFTIDIDGTTGAISNFQVRQTVLFKSAGVPLNGLAPSPTNALGNSFDPEGIVVVPQTGNFLVSDEYGPSVLEFDRDGNLLRRFTVPANLVPQSGAVVDYASTVPTLTSGREPNRGYEGLAISPDGKYAYAMLQNGTITDRTTASRGAYTRIVKYDIATGTAVGQYAYELESTGQGRGISAIVALGDDRFLVLERNNRGIGVDATVGSPDKNIFEIDLSGASDVTGINLPATGDLPAGYNAATKSAQLIDLDANTLAALGGKAPEKMEGFAVGPMLADGSFMLLMGTDNDYSVTQNGAGEQFDVYFNFAEAVPLTSSIQCPIGSTVGCTGTLTDDYALIPGVLQSYKANINGYVPTVVPEPSTGVLMTLGLGLLGGVVVRRRRAA